jgi:hypothetical protein
MSNITLSANAGGSGIFTIASPNSNTNRTLTLPDVTGTFNVSGAATEVPSGSASTPSIYPTGDTNTGIFFPSSDTIAFTEGGVESARIDASGNFLVGTTDPSAAGIGFKVVGGRPTTANAATSNSTTTYEAYSTGASAFRFYVGYGGTIFATSTTISAISDIRFKENVRDLDAGLAQVMALKPRLYDWKEGKGADIKNARGFIAQEFETVFPDLIDEWKDPVPEGEEPYKSVRADLIPVLVKAIQEQQALITSLTARMDAQAAEIAALKGAA